MFEGDLELGGLREPGYEAEVQAVRSRLPDVLIAGRAVEIRGDGAQLVQSILEEWLVSQQRRVGFLREKQDPEARRQASRIVSRMNTVERVLRAWEGVLTLPREDSIPGFPGN